MAVLRIAAGAGAVLAPASAAPIRAGTGDSGAITLHSSHLTAAISPGVPNCAACATARPAPN